MSILNGMVNVVLPPEAVDFLIRNCDDSIKQGQRLLMPLADVELTPPQRDDIRSMMTKFEIIKAAAERSLR